MLDHFGADPHEPSPETISTGESSYSIGKRKDGVVSIKAIHGGAEKVDLPQQIGEKVYDLMKMQDIAERHLDNPQNLRKFGEIFIRYFGGVSDADARTNPIKALQKQLSDLNCHWLGRTLLPQQYYTIAAAPRQKFDTFASFAAEIAHKKLPWVGQIYPRSKEVDESGKQRAISAEPIHSFVALANDAGKTVCFEKIGYHASFRIVPLEHIYRAWERALHTAPDAVGAFPDAEPYFAFSAELVESADDKGGDFRSRRDDGRYGKSLGRRDASLS